VFVLIKILILLDRPSLSLLEGDCEAASRAARVDRTSMRVSQTGPTGERRVTDRVGAGVS
jgi:hypothetical protein